MEQLSSKTYFDTVSSDWDDMGSSFFGEAPRERIYSELHITADTKIADIGSGSGYLLEGLTDHQGELYAIDQSQAMLDQIAAKFADKKAVHTVQGTSESLGLDDGAVDIAVANMYLHHVERPAAAIAEIARILPSGGTFAFTDLDTHEHEFLVTEQHDRWMGFDRGDIRQWMEDAGFTDIMIDCVGANCCATSQGSSSESAQIDIFIAKGTKA